jgi:hypothetical protein
MIFSCILVTLCEYIRSLLWDYLYINPSYRNYLYLCVFVIAGFLGSVRRPIFRTEYYFSKTVCVLFFSKYQVMGKVQIPSNSYCNTQSSGPFKSVKGVFVFLPSKLTSSTQTWSWCDPFRSYPSWYSYTFLMVKSNEKLERNYNKASLCFRPFWVGNASGKYLPLPTLM